MHPHRTSLRCVPPPHADPCVTQCAPNQGSAKADTAPHCSKIHDAVVPKKRFLAAGNRASRSSSVRMSIVPNDRSHAGGEQIRAPIARYAFRSRGTFTAGTEPVALSASLLSCCSQLRGQMYGAVGSVSNSGPVRKVSRRRYRTQPSLGSSECSEEHPMR